MTLIKLIITLNQYIYFFKYFGQVDHLDKLVHIDQINRFDLLGLGLNIEVCPET